MAAEELQACKATTVFDRLDIPLGLKVVLLQEFPAGLCVPGHLSKTGSHMASTNAHTK